eukprot:TRINITY_DN26792_c0_g1_i2.p1 TRINITY_DN26792_c0_g1~~TRINITY_DN26792_c0_g1_i2.p1  ORF type:complete len:303 (+),score=124.83 TRINITY_DN26792_c0_g1_i2:189-1097(+)
MLRLGMTNPPYILEHLDAVAEILNHPRVYAFLHVPVQAGCNDVLQVMQREYTVEEFEMICDTLLERVPDMLIATDIICGFPSESEESFQRTLRLCQKYEFPALYISQFYPRSGTPAAAMKQLITQVKKDRSRRITQVFESYGSHTSKIVGTVQRVWITEKAHDGVNLVGHTKCYVQVLISPEEAEIGTDVEVKIVSATKHSVKGTTDLSAEAVHVPYVPAVRPRKGGGDSSPKKEKGKGNDGVPAAAPAGAAARTSPVPSQGSAPRDVAAVNGLLQRALPIIVTLMIVIVAYFVGSVAPTNA